VLSDVVPPSSELSNAAPSDSDAALCDAAVPPDVVPSAAVLTTTVLSSTGIPSAVLLDETPSDVVTLSSVLASTTISSGFLSKAAPSDAVISRDISPLSNTGVQSAVNSDAILSDSVTSNAAFADATHSNPELFVDHTQTEHEGTQANSLQWFSGFHSMFSNWLGLM